MTIKQHPENLYIVPYLVQLETTLGPHTSTQRSKAIDQHPEAEASLTVSIALVFIGH